ncbi:MAG: hypothetical protein ACYSUD_12565 [Planctomycetota bacterium]
MFARNRDRLNLQIPRWYYTFWGQGEMIRFAEKVDMNLAKRLKQLMLVTCIAGVCCMGSFLLTAIIAELAGKLGKGTY